VRLTKSIIAHEKAGWDLLFYSPTGKMMKTLCNWEWDRAKQEVSKHQTKQQGKALDAPTVAKTSADAVRGEPEPALARKAKR
jgi:hypothetical protein